jgi:hypothetical protein
MGLDTSPVAVWLSIQVPPKRDDIESPASFKEFAVTYEGVELLLPLTHTWRAIICLTRPSKASGDR